MFFEYLSGEKGWPTFLATPPVKFFDAFEWKACFRLPNFNSERLLQIYP